MASGVEIEALAEATIRALVRDGNGSEELGAGSRRVRELLRNRLGSAHFDHMLARLGQLPIDADLARTVQEAVLDLLRSDKGLATAVRSEVEGGGADEGERAEDSTELRSRQRSEAAGNQLTIGTMKRSQLALGSITNSRSTRISLGLGIPIVLGLLLLAALARRGPDDSDPSSAQDASHSRRRTTGQSVAEPRTTAPPLTRETTTTTPPSPYSKQMIPFTTTEGWTYSASGEVAGIPTLVATKDISQSPPGQARLVLTLEVPGSQFGATGATPGRNAPTITFTGQSILFPLRNNPNEVSLTTGGGAICDVLPDAGVYVADVMQDSTKLPSSAIRCSFLDEGSYASSYETNEADVDAVVSAMSPGSPPIMIATILGTQASALKSSCVVLYFPDGSIDVGRGLREQSC
jgi:hypothetical protein